MVLAVIVIAALAVLAAVVFVAAGRGGGMPATEVGGYAPLDLGPASATDVALLRPPTALWGYNQQATDEALERIAQSIRDRDVRIVALEQLVADLGRTPAPTMPLGSPYPGARHARPGEDPGAAAAGQAVPAPTGTAPPGTAHHGTAAPETGGSGPSGLGSFGPEVGATGPLGAPVADVPDAFAGWYRPGPGGTVPGATPVEGQVQSSRSWESGTGWPPEVSHD